MRRRPGTAVPGSPGADDTAPLRGGPARRPPAVVPADAALARRRRLGGSGAPRSVEGHRSRRWPHPRVDAPSSLKLHHSAGRSWRGGQPRGAGSGHSGAGASRGRPADPRIGERSGLQSDGGSATPAYERRPIGGRPTGHRPVRREAGSEAVKPRDPASSAPRGLVLHCAEGHGCPAKHRVFERRPWRRIWRFRKWAAPP